MNFIVDWDVVLEEVQMCDFYPSIYIYCIQILKIYKFEIFAISVIQFSTTSSV